MTEADVETAVKRAEELWQKALDMRQKSDELSSQVFLQLPTPSRQVSPSQATLLSLNPQPYGRPRSWLRSHKRIFKRRPRGWMVRPGTRKQKNEI